MHTYVDLQQMVPILDGVLLFYKNYSDILANAEITTRHFTKHRYSLQERRQKIFQGDSAGIFHQI